MVRYRIILLIVAYSLASLSIIVSFTYAFIVSNALECGQIISNQIPLVNVEDVLYFSALTFYSNIFGNIEPTGTSKIISVIELATSYIFHAIVIGIAVYNITNRENL